MGWCRWSFAGCPPRWIRSRSPGLEALRQQDKANAHRALWLTLELLNIHRHLQTRGLEVLPYKGPVLAETLYGNVAMRQFSDLDLLIRSG